MIPTASFPDEPFPGPSPKGHAFRQIFSDHVDAVCRILRLVGVPSAHVEDAAQEVFLVIHDKLPTIDSSGSLRGYISSVAYRVGHNFRRKYRKTNFVSLHGDAAEDGPLVEVDRSTLDAGRLVERFAQQLEDGMRDVFVLVLLEERPALEVSELLGISINTVYSRVRLLREGFRRLLSEQMGDSQ